MTLSKILFAKPWSFLCYLFIVALSGIRSITCLFLIIFWLACGLVGANNFGKSWGIGGYVLGFLIGFLIPSILAWVTELAIEFFYKPLPVCRKGKCRGIGDYTFQIGNEIYWCSCGDKYIFKTREKKFVEILSDGTERPYKKLIGFRKWADDTK